MYGRMYKTMYRKMRGITLLELMIVVLIIGLMAVVAYPNYREFAARARPRLRYCESHSSRSVST